MLIIIMVGLQIIVANRIANYDCKSDCKLYLQIGLQFIEFGPRPTYVHNSAFSPPAEIIMIMMIVIIGTEIIIIIIIGLRIIIANWIANYNFRSDCKL